MWLHQLREAFPTSAKIFRVATFDAIRCFIIRMKRFLISTRFRRVTRYDGAGRDEF